MSVVVNDGRVCFSGYDAASFCYNTRKGLCRFAGVFSWLFCRKISVPESVVIKQIWPDRDTRFIKSYLKNRKISSPGTMDIACFKTLPAQQHAYSCIARSLQLAACELGVKRLPENDQYMFTGQSVDDPSAEDAIYAMTGRLLDSHGQLKPELGGNVENGGYSDPVGVQNAVKALGLDARLYCSSRLVEWYFRRHYPSELKETRRCCPIHHSSPPSLCNNERLLVHICGKRSTSGNGNGGQQEDMGHCLMVRPGGSCYDPGTGKNHASVEDCCATVYVARGLKPSGICMLISNGRDYGSVNP